MAGRLPDTRNPRPSPGAVSWRRVHAVNLFGGRVVDDGGRYGLCGSLSVTITSTVPAPATRHATITRAGHRLETED